MMGIPEFAALCGVSRASIYKAAHAGRIRFSKGPDGARQIDETLSDSVAFRFDVTRQRRQSRDDRLYRMGIYGGLTSHRHSHAAPVQPVEQEAAFDVAEVEELLRQAFKMDAENVLLAIESNAWKDPERIAKAARAAKDPKAAQSAATRMFNAFLKKLSADLTDWGERFIKAWLSDDLDWFMNGPSDDDLKANGTAGEPADKPHTAAEPQAAGEN